MIYLMEMNHKLITKRDKLSRQEMKIIIKIK